MAEMIEQPSKKEELINDWILFKLFETQLKGKKTLILYNKQFISRNILEREMSRYKELYPETFSKYGWSNKKYDEFEKCISTSMEFGDYERFANKNNLKIKYYNTFRFLGISYLTKSKNARFAKIFF